MDFPQQGEVHFPGNASPAADAPLSVTTFQANFPAPQHPQSASLSHRRPVPGQPPHDHADVVRDAVVSDRYRGVPSIDEDAYACAVFSSHRRMLLVIIGQTRTGKILCPHPLKPSLHKVSHKTHGTLAIMIWPMITLRYTSIVIIMLSTTMLGSL